MGHTETMLVIKAATCEKDSVLQCLQKDPWRAERNSCNWPQLYSMDYKNSSNSIQTGSSDTYLRYLSENRDQRLWKEINTIYENFRNFTSLKDKTENDSAESFRPEKR